MKTNIELIKLFGCVINDNPKLSSYRFNEVNTLANKRGYIVAPYACNDSVVEFLKSMNVNYNSTFYSTWYDIISKDRLDLLFDQLLHYASTYGTDFNLGNGYVPNDTDKESIPVEPFENYKVITAVTTSEMNDRCLEMFKSGIALKQSTMMVVADFMIDYYKGDNGVFPIDDINNKEALVYICDKLGIAPNDKFALFRYIIYKTTRSTMIIQNDETINKIKYSSTPFDFNHLTEKQLIGLASIYYRFKNLFVAFKHNTAHVDNRYVINKLNRLAPKYHTPFVPGIWENVLGVQFSEKEITNAFDKANNFKLITILQAVSEKIASINSDRMYYIRNGKSFFKESKQLDGIELVAKLTYYQKVYRLVKNELVNRMKLKACIVKYPKGINLTCPTSEKNFVGDIPFGTSFDMGNNSFVGIYWRNEWGTRDFDLSMNDENQNRIGWNADYYSEKQDVIYSGDMTNANPEATEILQFTKGAPSGVVMCTQYNGNVESKFRMFFGVDDNMNLHKNYMVAPDKITLQSDVDINKRETMIGLVKDGKFYVMSVATGNRIVSNINDMTLRMFNAISTKASTFVNVKDILNASGFIDYDMIDPEMIPDNADIVDLTDIKRDTLINLFM